VLNISSQSISELLGHEYSRRRQRNSSYSMRAFARDLRLSPSRLSEVMSGKHGLSESSLDAIAERLTTKPKEQRFLKDLVLSEFSRNEKVRELARRRVEDIRRSEAYVQLREDQFRVISDWYHAAILELVTVRGFNSDSRWIAKRLGISHSTAEAALARLQKFGLIQHRPDGGWKARPEAMSAVSDVPSRAIRKFHLQVLQMSADSLRDDDMDERESLSLILAVPRARLGELQEEMRKFVAEFWQKIADDEKDDLYSFSLQFCPVKNRLGENDV
jgi:uncharacterized protein (TIGR02147 family)